MTLRAFQVFRSGAHTAASGASFAFTRTDLLQIAHGYDIKKRAAPLVLGHPEVETEKFGTVQRLMEHGDSLYAIAEVDGRLIDLVRAGRYFNVSASFLPANDPRNPTPGRYYLRHIGFLGAQPPSIKGMQPLAFAEHSLRGGSALDFAETGSTAVGRAQLQLYGLARDLQHANPSLGIVDAALLAQRALQ